jgi:outer membrane protein assembly factor BamB
MKKMKTLRNKTKTATIALVLVLTIAASFITCLPAVNATAFDTYAFIVATPDPIGVGQTATVVWWLNLFPPTAGGVTGDRWQNITVTITKPDGSEQTLGPLTSDAVGSNWFTYVPDTVGKYYFQLSFPGQTLTGKAPNTLPVQPPYDIYVGQYYGPSTSAKAALTVQQEQIEPYQEAPIPTEYWDRPIEGENREWWQISGNWLQAAYSHSGGHLIAGVNLYTTAPNTAHIVWTKPTTFGGVIGGEFGSAGYSTSAGSWGWSGIKPPVIINGRLYYNTSPSPGFVCVDLRTGEELWRQNDGTITLGQILNLNLLNQHGGIPYLWSTGATYEMRDAFSGDLILKLTNARTGTTVFSPNGEMLVYVMGGAKPNQWLAMWNSSNVPGMYSSPAAFANQTGTLAALTWSPPYGKTLDWRTGIQWNVSIPDVPGVQSIREMTSDVILATTGSISRNANNQTEVGYDARTGEQMWVEIRPTIIGATTYGLMGPMGYGVYTEFTKETMTWSAYSYYTGEKVWGPTEPYTNAWGSYPTSASMAYGKLYTAAYDGMLHCYNLTTGEHLWDYYAGSSGFQTPYGTWPLTGSKTIADGKIFIGTGEHSLNTPIWTGEKLHVIDAETGDGVWNISGVMGSPAIADGYLVTLNGYDNQVYCFGKGKTATTVTAPESVQPLGTPILIKGTVTDQSPGAKDTPAISDEDMTEWMEYLYMQKPIPEDAEGVEVILTTLDPNGNTYELGRTTTDISGTFGCVVDPPVPGKYKIIATFEGSESYFSSTATSYFVVGEAPSAAQPIEPEPTTPAPTEPTPTEPEPTEPEPTEPQTTEPEPTEPEPTEPAEAPLFSTTDLAIIAAVAVAAVIGIAAYWQLRKRK